MFQFYFKVEEIKITVFTLFPSLFRRIENKDAYLFLN